MNLIGKPVKVRCGPATVQGSFDSQPLSVTLGKGIDDGEPEPGDLPFLVTPLYLRMIGRCLLSTLRRSQALFIQECFFMSFYKG